MLLCLRSTVWSGVHGEWILYVCVYRVHSVIYLRRQAYVPIEIIIIIAVHMQVCRDIAGPMFQYLWQARDV